MRKKNMDNSIPEKIDLILPLENSKMQSYKKIMSMFEMLPENTEDTELDRLDEKLKEAKDFIDLMALKNMELENDKPQECENLLDDSAFDSDYIELDFFAYNSE